ncbi:MAG TPA: prepilin peptidase [Microbacteriaceae bacterium]|nr:prepilin peptidase [Microbacteriaceae bacterium]
MLALTTVLVGVLGLLVGSFLNVVIHRVPAGRSVVTPPSACQECGARIRWHDNMPLVSWLVLRGRCRDCGARISARYPLVELGTGVAFALVALGLAPDGLLPAPARLPDAAQWLVLAAYLAFAAAGIALAIIDVELRRLPTPIIVVAGSIVGVCFAAAAVLRGDLAALLTAVVTAVAMGALYLVIALIRPDGMGLGDVRLAVLVGLVTGWVGWPAAALGLLSAFLLGALLGIAILLARRGDRRTAIPFGPWMLVGAWIGILAGPAAWQWYGGLLGLA